MPEQVWQSAAGKIILTGEHAVVYGQPAIAGAFPNAIEAQVRAATDGVSIRIPQWHYHAHSCSPSPSSALSEGLPAGSRHEHSSVFPLVNLIIERLGLTGRHCDLELRANVHPGMGLGASASLAVATIRSLDYYYQLGLNNSEVNAIAFECETLSHGTPSGIDNYMACYGGLVSYQRHEGGALSAPIELPKPVTMLVVMTHEKGATAQMLNKVASGLHDAPCKYQGIFDEIGNISRQAHDALQRADLVKLGHLMTANHRLLADIGVSTASLDCLVSRLLDAGALGAKLTGSGGGGAVIALCGDNSHTVSKKMAQYEFVNDVMEVQLGA